jgi:dynein heavy chain 2
LSAAVVTYLSSKSEDERKEFLESWKQKVGLEKFDFRRFMCTESQLLTWKLEGLPSDQLSVENSIVITEVIFYRNYCIVDLLFIDFCLFFINKELG